MAFKQLPGAAELRQLLDYNPTTGLLYWKERDGSAPSWWNARYAGTLAGRARPGLYIVVKVLGGTYLAHRLIWKIRTGEDPQEIDHINRDKQDNRWVNLRNVDHSANMRNRGLLKSNTSGHRHISWSQSLGRWVVQFRVPGKGQRQVAYAKTIGEAVEARDRAYVAYGYETA